MPEDEAAQEYIKTQKTMHSGLLIAHAALYVLTNIFLIIINLSGGRQHIWFFYPLLIWGLFLGLHFLFLKWYFSGKIEQIINRLAGKL